MKKTILIAVAVCLSTRVFAQTQPITLQVGERLPNLYYWDTNWIDYQQQAHCGSTNAFCGYSFTTFDAFWGRPCITNTPMRVIGIACLALKKSFGWSVLDSIRLPEFLYLYQVENDSLFFLDSGNWDTATVNYRVKLPFSPTNAACTLDSIYNLYEVFFDEPVIVHDTFVVGGTTHNNIVHGVDSELFPDNRYDGYNYTRHLPTAYARGIRIWGSYGDYYMPNPPYYYFRYCWPYEFWSSETNTDPLSSPNITPYDTSSFSKIIFTSSTQASWLPFFAIFDTNFDYEACMGVRGSAAYLESVDSLGNATFAWDDNGVEQWQVSVAPQGVEADSGTLYASPVNYLQVSGLTTGQWYEVWVRTLCDTDIFGAWYGPTLFYVPGASCVTPTGLHVVAVDSAMVSLAWDAGTATTWQVERGMCDLGMSNAQTVTTQAPTLTVADLPFGNAWYWARVRVVCDSDFWSDWTDTVRFFVPNQHTGGGPDDPTQAINLVEQYTYLMPNPARDEVTVASSFRVKAVELYAADGKLLQQVEVNAVGTTLSLEGLPAGIYFVRVRTSAGVTTKRLVVE